jgi:hypothetical protein
MDRVRRHGVSIGEYRTVAELAKVVVSATLGGDDPGQAATSLPE